MTDIYIPSLTDNHPLNKHYGGTVFRTPPVCVVHVQPSTPLKSDSSGYASTDQHSMLYRNTCVHGSSSGSICDILLYSESRHDIVRLHLPLIVLINWGMLLRDLRLQG